MMLDEPHIDVKALEAITAAMLVTGERSRCCPWEHRVEIYHHIPNSQLAIFPKATYLVPFDVPFDGPALFNATVERFFRTPLVKKDRINDTLKSFENGAPPWSVAPGEPTAGNAV